MRRLLIVDDLPLFRVGIGSALAAADFEVVGEATTARDAVEKARELQPDVVLLDILMPGGSGLEVVDEIISVSPGSKVMLLTASESEEDLLIGVKAGARAYLTKDTPLPDLIAAIDAVGAGGAVLSPTMAGKLLDVTNQLLRHEELLQARKPTLTGREIEVLELVAQGNTSREIGDLLFISENTVKNHIRNILDKLGLHSRNEAVLYAVREDLITI
ncbi:MAG: response regulator transcription factor [Actinobacteria bacterium]|jgi:two-component system NarL family response regulator|nr:response regulator transcription factor [Actinomycetota bacterium]